VDIKKGNRWIKYAPLIVLIILIFVLINPSFFQSNFEAKSPNSLLAGDAYGGVSYIYDIDRMGNFNQESQFILGFTGGKVTLREMPLFFIYGTFLYNLLGIEPYVAIFLGLLLGMILSISIFYIIIKKQSFTWAVFFLPCTLFLFTFPFIAGITWGIWKSYFMYFILATSFLFFLTRFTKERAVIFIIIWSSLILTHPSLLIYFLALFLIKIIVEKQDLKRNISTLFISGIITLTITLHYFLNYAIVSAEPGGTKEKILGLIGAHGSYHLYAANPYTSHFGFFWYIALAGFAYSLFYLFQNIKKRETFKFKLFSLFSLFFIIFLLPVVGLTRINQFRLVWPLYVSVFVGLVIYLLFKIIKDKFKIKNKFAIFIIYLILLVGLVNYLQFSKTNYSITNEEQWDTYMFINENTNTNATLLLINPVSSQNEFQPINRKLRYYDLERFSKATQTDTSLTNLYSKFVCDPPKKTRDGFKIYSNEEMVKECEENREKNVPPCTFDYILINKQFQNQEQVNLVQEFISELDITNYQMIKESQQTLLLKNNKVCKENEI
jgi:hypothetical protein